ncbi:MAG TPA: hypothetical protein VGK53_02465 [Propionicimonas sp.]
MTNVPRTNAGRVQHRFAEVTPELTAIIGRVPETFEAALRSWLAE